MMNYATDVDIASEMGDIGRLKQLFGGLDFEYTNYAMDWASINGHIEVLDWWLSKSNCIELKYSELALDLATDIETLEWWLNSGLELRYTIAAVDTANLAVIKWWWRISHKNPDIEFKCSEKAIYLAIYFGENDIIDWFNNVFDTD